MTLVFFYFQVPRSRGLLRDAERVQPPFGGQLLHQLRHLLLRGQDLQVRAQARLGVHAVLYLLLLLLHLGQDVQAEAAATTTTATTSARRRSGAEEPNVVQGGREDLKTYHNVLHRISISSLSLSELQYMRSKNDIFYTSPCAVSR